MVYESSESANNLLSASASTNHTSARRTLELWTCDNDGEGAAIPNGCVAPFGEGKRLGQLMDSPLLYVSIFHMSTRRGSLSGFQSGLDADS